MKYLSISPTITVRLSSIDALKMDSDNVVKVYVGANVFESFIPLGTFMELLNTEADDTLAQDVRQLASNSQFFNG